MAYGLVALWPNGISWNIPAAPTRFRFLDEPLAINRVSGQGRCPGRLCHGVSGQGRCPGRLCHGVSGQGRRPGRLCHGVSGQGRRPGR